MKKNSAGKNTCKLCHTPVNNNTGIQCKGACKKWMHFECLNFTPGKILDIKKGIIQVNCPCPTCKTTAPKEFIVDCPTMRGDKSSPKAPVCEEPLCPSHFKNQDTKVPCPANPPNQDSLNPSDNSFPCMRPLDPPPPRKPCPDFIPCRPSSEPKSKPKMKLAPMPRPECVREKPKPVDKPCPAFMKPEKSKGCFSQKTIFFPEPSVSCECPDFDLNSEKDNGFCSKQPPCEPPQKKKSRGPPEKHSSGMKCLCPPSEEESAWECMSPPRISKSYPECCPQGPDGQRDLPCGYIEKNVSEYKLSCQDENNDALICTLQNLCATMGELSKQVQNLMRKLIPNCQ